jgi:hypothetical protein
LNDSQAAPMSRVRAEPGGTGKAALHLSDGNRVETLKAVKPYRLARGALNEV